MADSPDTPPTPPTSTPAHPTAWGERRPLPVLGACGCGSGCTCGCQSGGACQCAGSCC